jgi:hypothetical protein
VIDDLEQKKKRKQNKSRGLCMENGKETLVYHFILEIGEHFLARFSDEWVLAKYSGVFKNPLFVVRLVPRVRWETPSSVHLNNMTLHSTQPAESAPHFCSTEWKSVQINEIRPLIYHL